jgi:hypothetical protein
VELSNENKTYNGKILGKDVVICTVDAFNSWLIKNECTNTFEDIFLKICESIKDDNIQNTRFNLNKRTLVIVDEV